MNLFRRCITALVAAVVIVTFHNCSKKKEFPPVDKLAVKWELVTNFTDSADVFNAKFVITNNSDRALMSHWKLFFNMAPRPILKNREPQPALVQHLNGDWYQLSPEHDFVLDAGKTVEVSYRGTEAVIKNTDRPLGLYFVFYDGDEEKQIAEVSDYTFSSFSSPDQINRKKDDEQPVPTPDWLYAEYQKVAQAPARLVSPIVPTPARLTPATGYFEINGTTRIIYDTIFSNEAKFLQARIAESNGLKISLSTLATEQKRKAGVANNTIVLQFDKSFSNDSPEAYRLSITPRQVLITARDAAGAFYGAQSLRMLFPLEALKTKSTVLRVPAMTVEDAPRFNFRSVQVDVSRNFQTKESIMRMIDLFALYKINHFLLYTTEDEGWRLEIKDLPELTDVGAQRHHTKSMHDAALHPAYGSGPFAKKEGSYGHGYYTREDFIEILRYAHERHVTIIPEVNFPGHARAAIKAMEARYERLMKEGKKEEAEEYRLIDPDDQSVYLSAQGYKDNVVCVARESVFHFYEKVVDEITAMYKEAGLTLEVFHTGGDEVAEGAWTKSPMATALLKQHPEIKDPKNLQMWFFKELVKRLKSRNLELHGWEEVALVKGSDGKYHPNNELASEHIVPYIWNNLFDHDLSYRLANAGFKIVLCNVSNFYFDLAYDKDPNEAGLYWAGFVNEKNAWTFAPFDLTKTTTRDAMGRPLNLVYESSGDGKHEVVIERLRKEAQSNVIGVEAQLWSETVKGREMMEYYVLPKLMGFSESAWAQPRVWETIEQKGSRDQEIERGWSAFATGLGQRELPRLSYLNGGYNYRVPVPGAIVDKGVLKANTAYPGLEIRYTLDGTEPTRDSPLYTHEIPVTAAVKLRCFDSAGKGSRSISLNASRAE